MNKDGNYICEDLHTSYNATFVDTSITTIKMIEYYQNTKTIKSNLLNKNQLEYLNTNIVDVVICGSMIGNNNFNSFFLLPIHPSGIASFILTII